MIPVSKLCTYISHFYNFLYLSKYRNPQKVTTETFSFPIFFIKKAASYALLFFPIRVLSSVILGAIPLKLRCVLYGDSCRYLKDFFISMIDVPWSYLLLGTIFNVFLVLIHNGGIGNGCITKQCLHLAVHLLILFYNFYMLKDDINEIFNVFLVKFSIFFVLLRNKVT